MSEQVIEGRGGDGSEAHDPDDSSNSPDVILMRWDKLSRLVQSDEDIVNIATKLRTMCAKPAAYDVSAVRSFLSSLPSEIAEAVINCGNSNGKTAFHHACQLRATHEIAELMIEYKAAVNTTTRRCVCASSCAQD
jgi:ankyrin repeat protein